MDLARTIVLDGVDDPKYKEIIEGLPKKRT